MRFILLLLIFQTPFLFSQQTTGSDLSLLKKGFGSGKIVSDPPSPNNKKVLNSKRKTAGAAYNPIMLIMKGSMLMYQHVISPQFSAGCLYQRSCSNYAKFAIENHGLIRGILLTADRLTRCNRSALKEVPAFYFDSNGKVVDEPCIHFDE